MEIADCVEVMEIYGVAENEIAGNVALKERNK